MPTYRPLITTQAWSWHVDLERKVQAGLMQKVPSDYTLSGFAYIPTPKKEEVKNEDLSG